MWENEPEFDLTELKSTGVKTPWEKNNVGEGGSEQQRWNDGGSTPVIIWSFSAITLSFGSASRTHPLQSSSLTLSHAHTQTYERTNTHPQKAEHL